MHAFRQVQGVMSRLEEIVRADNIVLDEVKEDFFGDVLDRQNELWRERKRSSVKMYLVAMSREILIVLNRQYSNYLTLNDDQLQQLEIQSGE